MRTLRLCVALSVVALFVAAASPALGVTLANRVFVSQRSGNDSNACSNILTPCQTFAGAVVQLNLGGEVIVLDSGGYGPVTITQSLTIEAPPGVLAFIHPPSGDAITVNAGSSDVVTLRGLVLNGGTNNGITVTAVGTLNVENCFITGFSASGIAMTSAGRLNVQGTDVKACEVGIEVANSAGLVQASIDHCHLDTNGADGFYTHTTSPGGSTTTVTNSTANGNGITGWVSGFMSSGQDVLNLEFCIGSENVFNGLYAGTTNVLSAVRYSNCVFTNNGNYGVFQSNASTAASRGNNTITGNVSAATLGTIGSFSAM